MKKRTTSHHPKRWDTPFGPDMSEKEVARVLTTKLFGGLDTDSFPQNLPLEKIILNDTRLIKYQKGDIIVRVGDYGSSAFLVVSGEVGVVLPPGLHRKMLGHSEPKKRSIFSCLASCFKRTRFPEVRKHGKPYFETGTGSRVDGEATRVYIQDVESVVSKYTVVKLSDGKMFGEIAALARTPRTATVFATQDVELLEIRWQALRDIRRYDEKFRNYVDTLYRKRNLITHLKNISLFAHLDDADLEQMAKHTLFESYGSFDWAAAYNRQKAKLDKYASIEEIVIVSQGDYMDGLLLFSSGFGKVAIQTNHGYKSLSTLGHKDIFGLEEIFYNWKYGKTVSCQAGLWALGYADILRVPTFIIEELVLPKLPEEFISQIERKANSWVKESPAVIVDTDVDAGLMEFLVYHRYINGTQTMMIDLDRCTHCDECVHACANGHNGNPRFIRHGRKYNNKLVANACMHCVDPVCLINCPTGAIHRTEKGGAIVINDNTCIGCQTCAGSCPYDNIRMVEIRTDNGTVVLDESNNKPILKATKCNLCFGLPGGPACQRACPHDALIRIEINNQSALSEWINRS